MAEIFETGSAVLGVAAVAFKLFTLIVEISDATRTIRSQINNDALPFRSFRDLIETAEYSIKFRLPAAGTDLVGYMHDRNIFGCIAEEAKALDGDIAVQVRKIQLLQQKHANKDSSYANRFYAAWRWEKIRKPKLELLHPRMEQLKSTIQLILAIIQLEVMARSGEASQSRSQSRSEAHRKSEEIDALRELIQKHIEAIEQLRNEFPSGTQPRKRKADAAAEICYLASHVRNTGTVPRRARELSPPPLSESIQALTVTPDFSNWPVGELLPTTCPRCYQSTTATMPGQITSIPRPREDSRQRTPSGYSRRPSYTGAVAQDRSPSNRPERQRQRRPRPQQDTQSEPAPETIRLMTGASHPEPAPQFNANPEHAPEAETTNPDIVIDPPPAPDPLPEQLSEPQPEPEIGPLPKTNSNSGPAPCPSHPPSSFPLIDGQVPPQSPSRSPSLYPESDHELYVPVTSGETNGTLLQAPAPWVTRSRRPTAERLPPVIKSVEIRDHKNQWHSMQVHLDPSLYIPNRHEAGRKEIHYYGIVSLRTLIDELGWPEETLLEDPRFVEIPHGERFSWNLARHEGVGRVMLTWRVDQSDDEWANAVVPKMTRECIVSREDPCEQGVVLKAIPAGQNA
ncbi:hypothetical protein N0V85_007993 [Neurospora sp. IMI 360204]|nr:hypothetical protein N0V85_007993 [Neurospora sp. IMI 360204]